MSSLTTSLVNTVNSTIDLTMTTGNTSGPAIVVSSGTDVFIRGNTSANVFIANSSGVRSVAPFTVANTLLVTANASANIVIANTVNVVNGNISSNTLNLGTASISTTGYSRLPNGLLMQWGSVSSSSSVGDVTFPAAFSTLYSITATTVSTTTTAASTYTPVLLAANTTTANVRTSNTTSRTVYWQAIGV